MVHIRLADLQDSQLIHQLAWEVFPATYKELLSPDQIEYMMEWMYSISKIEQHIQLEKLDYFIAYKDQEACGYIQIEQQEADVFVLQKIYILPSFQGYHIGRFLFEGAIKQIKSIHPGPCLMKLHVNRDNKAVSFYERMGMKKIGIGDFEIGKGYYMNDYIMGIEI